MISGVILNFSPIGILLSLFKSSFSYRAILVGIVVDPMPGHMAELYETAAVGIVIERRASHGIVCAVSLITELTLRHAINILPTEYSW